MRILSNKTHNDKLWKNKIILKLHRLPKETVARKNQSRYECFPDHRRLTVFLGEKQLKEILHKQDVVKPQLLGIKYTKQCSISKFIAMHNSVSINLRMLTAFGQLRHKLGLYLPFINRLMVNKPLKERGTPL